MGIMGIMGIMEKKMETTIIMGYMGDFKVYIGVILGYIGLHYYFAHYSYTAHP